MRFLVTGATGFVGSQLARALSERGDEVRCLVRDRERATSLVGSGVDVREGDVLRPESLRGLGEDVDVAYYLVHSMAGGGDFAERESRAAHAFARMAKECRVGRVVYLGGLGEKPGSPHLRSRQHTAEILRTEGPPLTYFRAAMVVGSRSESYRTLRYLTERLPLMVAPSWLKTPTQPIAAADVIAYLVEAPRVEASAGREVQIGGPDVLSYGDMLDVMARVLGRRPAIKLPVPFLSPRISSLWLGLVTPVDTSVARPLVEGLRTETVVTDPSGAALFDIDPMSFEAALRVALREDSDDRAAE